MVSLGLKVSVCSHGSPKVYVHYKDILPGVVLEKGKFYEKVCRYGRKQAITLITQGLLEVEAEKQKRVWRPDDLPGPREWQSGLPLTEQGLMLSWRLLFLCLSVPVPISA